MPRPVPVRNGYALIATAGGLAVLLLAAGFLLGGWGWSLAVFGLVLLGFVVWFFRTPPRAPLGETDGDGRGRERTAPTRAVPVTPDESAPAA
jgi:hypothetical protein